MRFEIQILGAEKRGHFREFVAVKKDRAKTPFSESSSCGGILSRISGAMPFGPPGAAGLAFARVRLRVAVDPSLLA